jgi:hypothetical protein
VGEARKGAGGPPRDDGYRVDARFLGMREEVRFLEVIEKEERKP